MKRSTTLAAAVAAALAMSTGAYAQDLEGASANNLGPAVVGASQEGLFGGMGATGMAAASMGLMAVGFAATIGNFSSDSDPGPPAGESPPPPPPPPPPHHHHG